MILENKALFQYVFGCFVGFWGFFAWVGGGFLFLLLVCFFFCCFELGLGFLGGEGCGYCARVWVFLSEFNIQGILSNKKV